MKNLLPVMMAFCALASVYSCGKKEEFKTRAKTSVSGQQSDVQGLSPGESLRSLGKFNPSFYWVALEREADGVDESDGVAFQYDENGKPRKRTWPLKNKAGEVLAQVSYQFFNELRLEGTGRFASDRKDGLAGRLINVADVIVHKEFDQNGKPVERREVQYQVLPKDVKHGWGVNKRKLNPFRSLAVDPDLIPIGSKIYIPQARGAKIPGLDGVHDGIFYADDIGKSIQERRIDVFTSLGDQSTYFRKNGLEHGRLVEVFIIEKNSFSDTLSPNAFQKAVGLTGATLDAEPVGDASDSSDESGRERVERAMKRSETVVREESARQQSDILDKARQGGGSPKPKAKRSKKEEKKEPFNPFNQLG